MSDRRGRPPLVNGLSVEQAAALRGVHRSTIIRALTSGRLPGYKLPNGGWLLRKQDVEAWERSPIGRPVGWRKEKG
jgi:excisionase family DNA binding protein